MSARRRISPSCFSSCSRRRRFGSAAAPSRQGVAPPPKRGASTRPRLARRRLEHPELVEHLGELDLGAAARGRR
eukprot:7490435-Pyramimonas_sp.AAC.1